MSLEFEFREHIADFGLDDLLRGDRYLEVGRDSDITQIKLSYKRAVQNFLEERFGIGEKNDFRIEVIHKDELVDADDLEVILEEDEDGYRNQIIIGLRIGEVYEVNIVLGLLQDVIFTEEFVIISGKDIDVDIQGRPYEQVRERGKVYLSDYEIDSIQVNGFEVGDVLNSVDEFNRYK